LTSTKKATQLYKAVWERKTWGTTG